VTASAHPYLGIYLNDHLAGATAGVELARRAAGNAAEPEHAAALRKIANEIEEDRCELAELMNVFGVRESRARVALGLLAERLGRLKGNGNFIGHSPLTPFIELEALSLGVEGKLELWRALRCIATDQGLTTRLDELIDRGEAQRASLEQMRHELAPKVLA
jgi:hypothetical protein